jgi:hypothetical protein
MNKYKRFIPGLLCIFVAVLIMVRLTHYANFYAPAYFFWIGIILAIVGLISVAKPMNFLWIFDRKVALFVLVGGLSILIAALYCPVKIYHSENKQKIDSILPDYSFSEYHETTINASPEKVKSAWQNTPIREIAVVDLLMKIRGLPANKEEKDKVAMMNQCAGTFRTPDFCYFEMDSTEFITVMLIKASAQADPPSMKSLEQFINFNEAGYIKVVLNFRIIPIENGRTLVTTETRNQGLTPKDRRIFGRYWRVIYPGSAIIRRLWLDALAKKATR